jgi:isopenicillin N synthase-like dioxygenase
MQRWTNNEWISTMHRVVMPATEAQERRYSMAYFVNTNGDTPIEPLKCCRGSDDNVHKNGRVITAGEHLMAKHLASMGIVMDDDDKAENVSNNIMEKESCDASE